MNSHKWFCVTDGRPWYKQLVTGLFYVGSVLIAIPFVVMLLGLCYTIAVNYSLGVIALKASKVIGLVFIVIVSCLFLLAVWSWAATHSRDDGKQVVYTGDENMHGNKEYDIFRCRGCEKPINETCEAAWYE